ncbi:MAG: saccharopine dehydrogenase family protein [Promethearchaeota archaeon]
MPVHPLLLIGCGRMGRGITRMLLSEQHNQPFQIELWIFDPLSEAEDLCQQEVRASGVDGKLRHVRELLTKSDSMKLETVVKNSTADPSATKQVISILKKPITQVKPRLILNTATFSSQQIYIPLALETSCDYIDLGQKLQPMDTLAAMDVSIQKNQRQVRVIQECGLAPGLVNMLATDMFYKALTHSAKNHVHTVQMRVGGLPQHSDKNGNLHYGPTFSPEGLVYEYEGNANCIRNGELKTTSTFSNPEYWEDPEEKTSSFGIHPFALEKTNLQTILENRLQKKFIRWQDNTLYLVNLQARPTADGTSRMCYDPAIYERVTHLEYKTLRFSPHYQTWNKMKEAGSLQTTLDYWKLNIENPEITGYPDMVLLRVWTQIKTNDRPSIIELITLHDDIPVGDPHGFTAMQHLTGWPTVDLTMILLKYPPGTDISQRPHLLYPPSAQTAFKRSIEDVLQNGGIIAPYELVRGIAYLQSLIAYDRIPLCQLKVDFKSIESK